jgi:hypothetical protein
MIKIVLFCSCGAVVLFNHDMGCELGRELLCSHCSPEYFAGCQRDRHSLMNSVSYNYTHEHSLKLLILVFLVFFQELLLSLKRGEANSTL